MHRVFLDKCERQSAISGKELPLAMMGSLAVVSGRGANAEPSRTEEVAVWRLILWFDHHDRVLAVASYVQVGWPTSANLVYP